MTSNQPCYLLLTPLGNHLHVADPVFVSVDKPNVRNIFIRHPRWPKVYNHIMQSVWNFADSSTIIHPVHIHAGEMFIGNTDETKRTPSSSQSLIPGTELSKLSSLQSSSTVISNLSHRHTQWSSSRGRQYRYLMSEPFKWIQPCVLPRGVVSVFCPHVRLLNLTKLYVLLVQWIKEERTRIEDVEGSNTEGVHCVCVPLILVSLTSWVNNY